MKVDMIGISPDQLMFSNLHSHSQWEIVVCLKGTSTMQVGKQEIDFRPGVIVCQPPNVPHGSVSTTGFQDMWVRIDGFVPFSPEAVPVFQDDEAGRFTKLAKMLYETFIRQEPNSDRIVAALWDAMYQLMVSWSADRIRNPAVSSLLHDMVLNLSNPDYDLGRQIEEAGYSPDHLRRCFKKELGQTPTAYLNRLRIDHARRILDLPDHGGYSVKQIALLSGFSDPYYFSTTFKKIQGCSPMEYLRRQ